MYATSFVDNRTGSISADCSINKDFKEASVQNDAYSNIEKKKKNIEFTDLGIALYLVLIKLIFMYIAYSLAQKTRIRDIYTQKNQEPKQHSRLAACEKKWTQSCKIRGCLCVPENAFIR